MKIKSVTLCALFCSLLQVQANLTLDSISNIHAIPNSNQTNNLTTAGMVDWNVINSTDYTATYWKSDGAGIGAITNSISGTISTGQVNGRQYYTWTDGNLPNPGGILGSKTSEYQSRLGESMGMDITVADPGQYRLTIYAGIRKGEYDLVLLKNASVLTNFTEDVAGTSSKTELSKFIIDFTTDTASESFHALLTVADDNAENKVGLSAITLESRSGQPPEEPPEPPLWEESSIHPTNNASGAHFEEFVLAAGLTNANAELLADPDGDHDSNLVEFKLGGDPNDGGSKGSPWIIFNSLENLTYRQRISSPGAHVVIHYSPDLFTWYSAQSNITEISRTPLGEKIATIEEVQVQRLRKFRFNLTPRKSSMVLKALPISKFPPTFLLPVLPWFQKPPQQIQSL